MRLWFRPCRWGGSESGAAGSRSRPPTRPGRRHARSRSSAMTRCGTRRGSARASRSRTARCCSAATERIRVASGIANIWGRDAVASANAARVLADAFDDRFLLGLGVSHPRQVDPRGHRYEKPVARMSAYLDAMDDDPYVSPDGTAAKRPPVPRVLAALRPPMLRLAAEKSLGAHTYLVPVEHTRRARELVGPDALLIAEQKVVLASDPARRVHEPAPRSPGISTPRTTGKPPVARVLGRRLRGRRLGCARRRPRRRGRRGSDPGPGAGAPGRGRDPGSAPAARERRPLRARDAPAAGSGAARLTSATFVERFRANRAALTP